MLAFHFNSLSLSILLSCSCRLSNPAKHNSFQHNSHNWINFHHLTKRFNSPYKRTLNHPIRFNAIHNNSSHYPNHYLWIKHTQRISMEIVTEYFLLLFLLLVELYFFFAHQTLALRFLFAFAAFISIAPLRSIWQQFSRLSIAFI